ncbi:SRPBCC family protein [Nocardioides sp.]|uniref:SRPBCC family protein n=1 Tax=Nocardioides sp. TaxID=35761 RepID=UPI002D7F6ED2|nr:SRPBCC family protein [Nocardioides sp.]HET8961732.1 SRPBCC family protein [Nocardioides sp.]
MLPPVGVILRPMTGEVSLWMDAPPDRVWDLVSDVTRIGEFSPETFEARWTRGSTGPEVGASFKGHVRRNGVGPTYWSPCQVTKCVPHELFEFAVGTDDVTLNNWGYRLEPQDGGTLVTEYFRLEPKLPLRIYWTVLGALRGRTNERGMRTTLERMKEVLES